MQIYLKHIKTLFYRIILILVILQITRLYFLIINYSKYSDLDLYETSWAFIVGSRFDMVSVGIFASLFIFLSILPFRFICNKLYQKILKIFFILISSILIIVNLLDSEYFRFSQKRSTYDVLNVIQGEDFKNMVLGYISSYWFVIKCVNFF